MNRKRCFTEKSKKYSKLFPNTIIGDLIISATPFGVTDVQVYSNDSILSAQIQHLDEEYADECEKHIVCCEKFLESYFKRASIDNYEVTLDFGKFKDTFTFNIWNVLRKQVHFGECISYGGLASLCGNPRSARAVGSALNKNPFLIIVPCHRVIKSSGCIGKFGAGTDKKEILLEFENIKL